MTKQQEAQMVRLLSKHVGPVDLSLVMGDKPLPVKGGVKHMITLNNRRVSDQEAEAFKREANLWKETQLWKVFTETLRYEAEKRMFKDSQRSEDVFLSGKFTLWAISVMEHLVDACSNPLLLSEQRELSTPKRLRSRPAVINNNDK